MTKHSWFHEYCENSTSHCMQYFVMKHRSPVEKLFWVLTFLCMILMTFGGLRALIKVWTDSPTIMFIENTESPIRDIPFPSINICPSNQLRKWVWEKHMNTNSSYWEDIQQYRSKICSLDIYNTIYKPQTFSRDYFDTDVIKNLTNDCAISCSEVFQSDTKWENLTIPNICNFIQPKITAIGICFTVNMMPSFQIFNKEYHTRYLNFFSKNNTFVGKMSSKWNLDDGYPSNSENDMLVNINPARTSGVSYYHRLRLMLHSMKDEFLSCPGGQSMLRSPAESFFFITLSNPAEYFLSDPRSFVVPDTYTKIRVTPFVKKISSDLKRRSLEVRKCYLNNEKKLSIFQQYTEVNCKHECVLNETLNICGCVSIEMAFLVKTSVKICGLSKKECIVKARQAMYQPEMQIVCQCLPTCSGIEYEISYTSHYDDWSYMKSTNLVKNNSRGVTVEFVFNKPHFTAYISTSIVDLESLISNFGGIISLCLGLNLINFFEILFIVIKMVGNYIAHMFEK